MIAKMLYVAVEQIYASMLAASRSYNESNMLTRLC